MNGYYFELRCPTCGGEMAHQTDGRPTGATSQAIAACGGCGQAFVVRVEMLTAGPAPRTPQRVEQHDPIGPVHPVIQLIMDTEDEMRKVPA